jgi:RimJ/RimL family protein N-acetyltransferase
MFSCTSEGSPSAAHDVEEWVHEVLTWQAASPGRYVRVYYEQDDLVAVVAYADLVDGDPMSGYFIYLMALSPSYQSQPEQHAMAIALGLINHLGKLQPGELLVARVAVSNHRCHRFAAKLGAGEPTSPFDAKGFMEYRITLPDGL